MHKSITSEHRSVIAFKWRGTFVHNHVQFHFKKINELTNWLLKSRLRHSNHVRLKWLQSRKSLPSVTIINSFKAPSGDIWTYNQSSWFIQIAVYVHIKACFLFVCLVFQHQGFIVLFRHSLFFLIEALFANSGNNSGNLPVDFDIKGIIRVGK